MGDYPGREAKKDQLRAACRLVPKDQLEQLTAGTLMALETMAYGNPDADEVNQELDVIFAKLGVQRLDES